MGVGYLRIVDRDVVSRSDLHRQFLYDVDHLGIPKVEVAAKKLCRLNPDVELDPAPASLGSRNVETLLSDVDVVVDGFDRMEPRYLVNRACQKLKVPYIFGAAIEYFGTATSIVPGKTVCLECFYPDLKDNALPKCAVVGVHPSVTGVVSSIQVLETISLITGNPMRLQNKLLYVDLKNVAFDAIDLTRNDNCAVCGANPRSPAKNIEEQLVEETCARDGRRVLVISPHRTIQIDPKRLKSVVESQGMNVDFVSHFGITFRDSQDVKMSILRSGVLIVQAPPRSAIQKDDVLRIYEKIVNSS
jgi:adenylyltransferase/sulfurtransferase